MIKLDNVSKTYKVACREKGLVNAFKSLFKRKYKTIEALKNVSFTVNEGVFLLWNGHSPECSRPLEVNLTRLPTISANDRRIRNSSTKRGVIELINRPKPL